MGVMRGRVGQYFEMLAGLIYSTEATDFDGVALGLAEAFDRVRLAAHAAHDAGNKIIFLGNGGSAAIASHMAIDFSNRGRMRSIAFSDAPALTCIGNDFGYDRVFSKQVEFHARPGDLVVGLSSSGRSPAILLAIDAARERGCRIVTLSGFDADNPLRGRGDLNLYVRSSRYGQVEVAHHAVCHAILDLDLGWPEAP